MKRLTLLIAIALTMALAGCQLFSSMATAGAGPEDGGTPDASQPDVEGDVPPMPPEQ